MEWIAIMTLPPLLTGEKVRLTAFTDDDLKEYTRWYQDIEFMRLYDGTPARPRTEHDTKKWLEDMRGDKNTYLFAIRPRDSDVLVGLIEISYILWNHGNGWLSIAIGDPANRRKGYGAEAIALILDFAFRELNLHRVQLTVFGSNPGAIALYEKLGFTREGAHREFLHRDDQYYDMILYGILRREWEVRSKQT